MRESRPEPFGVALGFRVDAIVGDVRVFTETGRRSEGAILLQEITEFSGMLVGRFYI
jgi:hypothetical protein